MLFEVLYKAGTHFIINKKGKCVKEKNSLQSPIFELSLGGGIALGHYTLYIYALIQFYKKHALINSMFKVRRGAMRYPLTKVRAAAAFCWSSRE